jgi:hypothetical protein
MKRYENAATLGENFLIRYGVWKLTVQDSFADRVAGQFE